MHWYSSWEAKPDAGEIQSGCLFQWSWSRHAASQWLRGTVLPLWSWAPCRIFSKTQGGQKIQADTVHRNIKSLIIDHFMCTHTHTHARMTCPKIPSSSSTVLMMIQTQREVSLLSVWALTPWMLHSIITKVQTLILFPLYNYGCLAHTWCIHIQTNRS